MDMPLGRSNSKQGNGAVGILTADVIDRTHYYEHAVILALVPFKNTALTFGEKPSPLTPAIGHNLVEAFRAAGLPAGVFNFVPGRTEVLLVQPLSGQAALVGEAEARALEALARGGGLPATLPEETLLESRLDAVCAGDWRRTSCGCR